MTSWIILNASLTGHETMKLYILFSYLLWTDCLQIHSLSQRQTCSHILYFIIMILNHSDIKIMEYLEYILYIHEYLAVYLYIYILTYNC